MQKHLIFVVILFLAVALIYSPSSTFYTFAVPRDPNFDPLGTCAAPTDDPRDGKRKQTCCWTEVEPGTGRGVFKPRVLVNYCQTCSAGDDCSPKQRQGTLEQAPPTPPSGPFVLPEEGVLQEPTPPPSGPAAPLQEGVVEQPPADQGAAELPPPATEETQPANVEEEHPVPVCQEGLELNDDLGFCVPTECPEGQILNEETGLCVLEEQEAVEEPEEQSEETVAGEPDVEQPSEGEQLEPEEDQTSGDSNSE